MGMTGQEMKGALEQIEFGLNGVARAITADGAPGHDETGGTICSLTEAVMGVTAGLCSIASAINNLAEAVRGREEP